MANQCTMSGARVVYEEREHSGRTVPTTAHNNPENVMLNTAQMRDAVHVQQLRIASAEISDETKELDIFVAVEREFGLQASRAKAAAAQDNPKGKTSTRGRPQTTLPGIQFVSVQPQRMYDISGTLFNQGQ